MVNYFNRQPAMNQTQLAAAMQNIDKNTLSQFVIQARQQGISEQEIESGLNFLIGLKNKS